MTSLSKNPSSFARLLACGQESIGFAAAEDLSTFLDVAAFEYVLCIFTCSVIGTSAGLTIKAVESAATSGASATTIKDADAVDRSAALPATDPTLADGNTVMLQIRTRDMTKRYFSPQLTAATAAMGVAYTIIGIYPRDTAELTAGWSDESSSVVEEASINFAP